MKVSLRTKGQLAFAILSVFVFAVAVTLDRGWHELLRIALELEEVHDQEVAISKASQATILATLHSQALNRGSTDRVVADIEDAALDAELVQSGLQGLLGHFPEFGGEADRLGEMIRALRRDQSATTLKLIGDEILAIQHRVDELAVPASIRRAKLWVDYYQEYDHMTMLAVTLNLIGALVLGTVIMLFLGRLTWDLRRLGQRARDVIQGYRGALLETRRTDEVGELIDEINQMQQELRASERKLEVAREQHFYREKMAAVGSVAAAVAHEVNNPIAAIDGIAQMMLDRTMESGSGQGVARADELRMIMEQTRRVAAISRQIADFTRPREARPELTDLNELVRGTCRFVTYDKRMRNVEVVLDLDANLPAISAVSDHLTQVLINLLINAADAFDGMVERRPMVRVTTSRGIGEVQMVVADNGRGMDEATRERAFEEYFSTKPPDRGRGLGLFLCRELLEQAGCGIELASMKDQGTTVTVRFPVASAS